MAMLVSLVEGKAHLRITTTSDDADITRKIEQASDIIIDFLAERANTYRIVSTSEASPTVITVDGVHGLSNGATVLIENHLDSEEEIDGTYVVSSVTDTTFTIPVEVTTTGTGGTVKGLWSDTAGNVPGRVETATLLMLTHLYERRGDDPREDDELWASIERVLLRSRNLAIA
jgi:Flp pilus assembly protein TadG